MQMINVIVGATAFPPREDKEFSGLQLVLGNGEILNTTCKFFRLGTGINLKDVYKEPTAIPELSGKAIMALVEYHRKGDTIPDSNGKEFLQEGYSVNKIYQLSDRVASIYENQMILNNGVTESAIKVGTSHETLNPNMDLGGGITPNTGFDNRQAETTTQQPNKQPAQNEGAGKSKDTSKQSADKSSAK